MKYFLDTEFVEEPCTIDLISIGIVSEDGRELYLESNEIDLGNLNPWMVKNILPHLDGKGISRSEIKDKILDFLSGDTAPEFWAYYADYDWVVFCWLFGRMIDLPEHFPMFCRDLKQVLSEREISRDKLPKQPENAHNALVDAIWVKSAYESLHGTVRP